MSEGRELSCALHFQLEAAMQITEALGGCILVVRAPGESHAANLAEALGLQRFGGAFVHADVDSKTLEASEDSFVREDILLTRNEASRSNNERDVSDITPIGAAARSGKKLPEALRLVAQFHCVALSGRTAHRAFAHEAMLTGVVESKIAMNITLAAEPFLALPLVPPNQHAAVGVLGLAYKAHSNVFQFTEEDESRAYLAAQMIAATLARCPASKFVEPYHISRLIPLGLTTNVASEATVLDNVNRRVGGGGLIYRSSSRAVLASKVGRLGGEDIPGLRSLMELSQVVRDLESLVLRQEDGSLRQAETQRVLERRLRAVQLDLGSVKTLASKEKSESEAFRLAGAMAQQKLDEHIAKTEVEKFRSFEMRRSVRDEVSEFLSRATKVLEGRDGQIGEGAKPFTFRGKPTPPVIPQPKKADGKPSMSSSVRTTASRRPLTARSSGQ